MTNYNPLVDYDRAFDLGKMHGYGGYNHQTQFASMVIAKQYLRGYNDGREDAAKLPVALDHFLRNISLADEVKTSEEVRTTSSTGGQKGVKPEKHSLIPVEALDIMARLYGFGAQKYAAHNWRKGYDWSKSYDSLIRHASAFWRGEDIDEETGLPHLAGAAFHCFTLMVFMQEHPEFDDRYKAEQVKSVADRLIEEAQGQIIPNPAFFDGSILQESWRQDRIAKALYEKENNNESVKTWEELLAVSVENEGSDTVYASIRDHYRELAQVAMEAS